MIAAVHLIRAVGEGGYWDGFVDAILLVVAVAAFVAGITFSRDDPRDDDATIRDEPRPPAREDTCHVWVLERRPMFNGQTELGEEW